jgi:uncharacterized protein with ParB-like and HNH nuclease domain
MEKDDNEANIQIEQIESEVNDSESTHSEYEISAYPADFTLEVFYQKWKNGDIELPPFQRNFVWTISQSSRLIESFMLGLPVPQIFIYTGPDKKSLIIDGQQRLRSIFFFLEGFFGEKEIRGNKKVFRLIGLNENSKWLNQTFDEFSDADKRKLKDSVLRAIIIKQLNPKDDTSIYHIFERLNTGGTLLKNQEVRNCVYGGNFNDLLLKLNKYPSWRKIVGKQKEDIHQKDVELILRYIALYHLLPKYNKPMKDFLSIFMNTHKEPGDNFLEDEAKRFYKTCDLVINILGEKPFSLHGGINPSLFDSVFVAFAKHLDTEIKDVKERYEKLKENEDFKKYMRNATTDATTIKERAKLAETSLFM